MLFVVTILYLSLSSAPSWDDEMRPTGRENNNNNNNNNDDDDDDDDNNNNNKDNSGVLKRHFSN